MKQYFLSIFFCIFLTNTKGQIFTPTSPATSSLIWENFNGNSGGAIVSLSKGNKWFYRDSSSYSGIEYKDGQSQFVTRIAKSMTIKTVIGDTVLNQKKFKIIESAQITADHKIQRSKEFWYLDSLKFALPGGFPGLNDNLTPLYYLTFPKDTSWVYREDDFVGVTNRQVNILGQNRQVQSWAHATRYIAGPIVSVTISTALGIGPIYYGSSSDGRTGDYQYSSDTKLAGALIDGVLLGDSISIPLDIAPAAPVLSAQSGNQMVVLKWTKSKENDFRAYKIYLYSNIRPSSYKLIDSINAVGDTTLIIRNLENGQQYNYVLTVIDQAGFESYYSNSVSATPAAFTLINLNGRIYNTDIYFTADYDNNGFPDIVSYNGYNSGYSIQFFRNGPKGYILDPKIGFPSLTNASICWADYNNDGYFDYFLTGWDDHLAKPVLRIYKNIAGQRLEPLNPDMIKGVEFSTIDWADFDNNGTLDFIITGYTGASLSGTTKLYSNLGNDNFSEVETEFPNVYVGNAEFGDFDNDGDQDILISGETFTKVYENVNFTFKEFLSIEGYQQRSTWGDFNNDGFLDIAFISRETEDGARFRRTANNGVLQILVNDNGKGFSKLTIWRLLSNYSFIRCQDIDQNGNLDIISDWGVFGNKLQILASAKSPQYQDFDNDGD